MKIHTEKRKDFHKAYQSGLNPSQIGEKFGCSEMEVVLTLRQPVPKIRGANYKGLRVPVPVDEVIQAFYDNTLDQLANKYHLTRTTLLKRLPEELRTGPGRPHIKKHEKLTQDQKTDIINRYFRSGRKLNACGVSSKVARDVLVNQNVPVRSHGNSETMHKRYQVALLDCLICDCSEDKISNLDLFKTSRILYELSTNDPQVWKGQLLDWFLQDRIQRSVMICINNAIDYIQNLKGYEDEST